MPSAALERFTAWVQREEPGDALARFRVAFAGIWLVYDVLDLSLGGTAHCLNWAASEAPSGLVGLQVGLILFEASLLLGWPGGVARPVTFMAAWARGLEWWLYFRLNDFAYYAVTAVILAHAQPEYRFLRAKGPLPAVAPRWPRDLLLLQAGWIYFATALMKANPTWLSGRHLYVRLEYLRYAFGWPFPGLVNRCADSLGCDAVLALFGIMGELTLAVLLVLRPRRWLTTPLVVGIHFFGAMATNVWFFGPSLIAQVGLLSRPGWGPKDESASSASS
jgi:hypothetical protein